MDGRPIVARPITIVPRVIKWLKRHRQTASVAFILAVVASLGLAGTAWQRGATRERQIELTPWIQI